ncbi:MAG: hypothetical protein M1457_11645, partial [bacterium]|nr:hypothetical protein [bacterium]
PAAYYPILRAWNGLGERCGLSPGVFWGRLPGVAAWGAMIAAIWFLARRTLGGESGALVAWSVAASAQTADFAKDMRCYALAVPALAVCFFTLLRLNRLAAESALTRSHAARLWGVYAICAAAALWLHLLSAIVLALLGLWWLAAVLRGRLGRSHPFVEGGALAQATVLVVALPVVYRATAHVHYLQSIPLPWMTPATPGNLLRVFALWYPLGRGITGLNNGGVAAALPVALPVELPEGVAGALGVALALLGVATLVVPLGALGWARLRRPGGERRDAAPRSLALAGLGGSALFVAALWILDRLGGLQVFHGPRYTVLANPLWAAGLAGLACRAAARSGATIRRAWLLMLPWLACGLAGQALAVRTDALLRSVRTELRRALPPPGATIYVTPAELLPDHARLLPEYRLRPLLDLMRLPPGTPEVDILRIYHPWPELNSAYEKGLLYEIAVGRWSRESLRIRGHQAEGLHGQTVVRGRPTTWSA